MAHVLLDANVLIALVVDDHVHHGHAEAWFVATEAGFATCPITQGSLMRFLIREGQTAESARSVLQEITSNRRHEFWPDNASYHDIPVTGIIGHRQVTDAYLAHLARSWSARLATFDQAVAKMHADVTDLIATS
jgi:toxin-antitoxin system PIN domain toxin